MAANSVNKPAFVPELSENVEAAGLLGDHVPTSAIGGSAVIDPTDGSYEALLAGTAAAVGAWKFRNVENGKLVYLVTAAPATNPVTPVN